MEEGWTLVSHGEVDRRLLGVEDAIAGESEVIAKPRRPRREPHAVPGGRQGQAADPQRRWEEALQLGHVACCATGRVVKPVAAAAWRTTATLTAKLVTATAQRALAAAGVEQQCQPTLQLLDMEAAEAARQQELRKKDEQVARLRSQCASALDEKRRLQQALEATRAKDAEAESKLHEVCRKEQQVAAGRDDLKREEAQLAQRRRHLEEEEHQLHHHQEQLLRGGSPPADLLPPQRSGRHWLRIGDIRWTQESIKDSFGNGCSVDQTACDLRAQRLSYGGSNPAALPTIRVVEYLGQAWTLDNRRLQCLRDAFGMDREIEVIVLPLSEPYVLEEFQRKLTVGQRVRVRGDGGSASRRQSSTW